MILFSICFLCSEFSEAEYKAAKVDPIAQFSKPVAVVNSNWPSHVTYLYSLFHEAAIFHSCWNSIIWQSHMNKDHAEDTKAIVQHWTPVPVCYVHMLK